jgi:sortase A
MRLVVQKETLRRVLLGAQLALFAGAVGLLGYAGFAGADAWLFQQRESRQFERLLAERQRAGFNSFWSGLVRTVPASLRGQPGARGIFGRLEIQRLGLSAMVIEGDDRHTLWRAVGHLPGSARPGENGNMVLTGHRDTFFRPLRNIRVDDVILRTTLEGQYRYRVRSTQVVRPDNVSVLEAGPKETLTLVTCHPFYFVGAAPNRFIVRAERLP